MTQSDKFDPEQHGFRKLDMKGPGDLTWFERASSKTEGEKPDPLRLNVYMTRDKDYTTIWFGMIDPSIAEMKLDLYDDPSMNFKEMYEETFFRGMIKDSAFGKQVLEAIRLNLCTPQALRLDENGKLECYSLT